MGTQIREQSNHEQGRHIERSPKSAGGQHVGASLKCTIAYEQQEERKRACEAIDQAGVQQEDSWKERCRDRRIQHGCEVRQKTPRLVWCVHRRGIRKTNIQGIIVARKGRTNHDQDR